MPKFEVLEKSFIEDRIYEAGSTVEYSGFVGENLKPLDDAAKALAKQTPSFDVMTSRLHDAAMGKPLAELRPR